MTSMIVSVDYDYYEIQRNVLFLNAFRGPSVDTEFIVGYICRRNFLFII